MLEAIFWVVVGAFIGWHVPQPQWAKAIQNKILGVFSSKNET